MQNGTIEGSLQKISPSPGPCQYFDYLECHLAVSLWRSISPVFITVGVLGNLVSLAVLSRKRMRYSTTSVYLRFLTIIDTLVLTLGNFREFLYYSSNVDIRELNDVSCKIHFWLTLNVTALSGWFLSVLTVDRLVSIKMPLWAKATCSRKSAVVISVAAIGVMFLINSHVLGYLSKTEVHVLSKASNTTITVDIQCLPGAPQYMMFWTKIWPFTVFLLYSAAPICCIIICNVMLIKEIVKRNTVNPVGINLTIHSERLNEFRSLNKMLVVVCVFFTTISLPTCIYMISEAYIFNDSSARDIAKRRLVWAIVSLLMYSNNAANFILYCLSGSLFRKELKRLLKDMRSVIVKCTNRRIQPLDNSTVAGKSSSRREQHLQPQEQGISTTRFQIEHVQSTSADTKCT